MGSVSLSVFVLRTKLNPSAAPCRDRGEIREPRLPHTRWSNQRTSSNQIVLIAAAPRHRDGGVQLWCSGRASVSVLRHR